MSPAQHAEKICWIWSDRAAREISVRIQFSMAEDDGCKIISLHGRDEWWV